MNPLLAYLLPCFAAGLVVGMVAWLWTYRRRRLRLRASAIGLILALGFAALWHGPLGGAERFASEVESSARRALDYYEMTRIGAQLQRAPLTRRLELKGAADDFQRSELVRILDQLPGVRDVQWAPAKRGRPLAAEAIAVALAGFLLGLLFAYLIELRRRYNEQWNW